ncbi:hypothetical protein, partial [Agrobacterium sp.]|uniref:hypothetical protein n=1 Tax=Agrobacterium sp. TaxID=361 RepID=UPI0040341535
SDDRLAGLLAFSLLPSSFLRLQVMALEAEAQSAAALATPDALEARFAMVRYAKHSHTIV